MTDFHCRYCKRGRFIGKAEGQGRFWLQCKACSKWQWVKFDTGANPASVSLAELLPIG